MDRGESAQAQVILDGRRSNAAQIAAYYLNRSSGMAATRRWAGPRPAAASAPPDADALLVQPQPEFQWFFLPNLIGMLSLMLGLVVTGLSVARERRAL
ncbi:MAG: hypothetical protein ACLU98_00175 [Desulfovibrio fairfieldensis]